MQCCIVELQFFQRVTQLVVFGGLGRVETCEHLGFDFLEARQRRAGGAQVVGQLLFQRDGVTHLGGLQLLDAGNDVAHLSGLEHIARLIGGREHAQAVGFIGRAGGHHLEALVLLELAIDHAHQHHDAHIGVKPAVHDHRAQGRLGLALGWRHLGHHGFQNFFNAHAGLGRAGNRVAGINADHIFDLGLGIVRVCIGQIHLVEHREHFHAQVQRGVAIGHRLGFNALRRIDYQQRTFAGRQRTRDFIGEVHVAGGVDQVQVVDLAVLGLVVQGRRLRLDGDTALFLDVHRVQHLCLHVALGQASAILDQAVRQGRLAMVNMGNDGKITNVLH